MEKKNTSWRYTCEDEAYKWTSALKGHLNYLAQHLLRLGTHKRKIEEIIV